MNCGNVFGANIVKLNNSEGRFYKYRAANLATIPVAACEELLSVESILALFKIMDEIYLKVFNMKLDYNSFPYAELTTNISSIAHIQNVYGALFPMELSGIALDNFWYHTPVFFTSELLLITGPPTEVGKYSMSFLTFDNRVPCLLLLCIFALPLLAKLSEFVSNMGKGGRLDKTSFRQKVEIYLNFSWQFVCIFFFEPFLRVHKCISWRITVGSWLIVILIISIFMGSALKTELYSTDHVLIDSLESLSKYTATKIQFSQTDNAASYFEEWETSIMQNQPELSLASRVEYATIDDALDPDNYRNVYLGKIALFVSNLYMDNLMSIILEGDADLRKLTFYFNAKRIKNLLFVFPISSELKKCPELIEQINLVTYVTTETKLLDYLFFKNNFYISRIVWKKPEKTISALTINETYGAFLLFAYCMAIATATLIAEVIIKLTSSFNCQRHF